MHRGSSGVVRCTALAVVVAIAVAGCTGDGEEPNATASTSGSASPSAEPSASSSDPTEVPPAETPPAMPAEALVADVDGAAAFIRHYFDVVNYAYRTGDVAAIAPLRKNECTACLGIEGGISDGYKQGGSINGGQITLTDVVVTPGDMSEFVEASIVGLQSEILLLDSQGAVVDTVQAQSELLVGVNLERVGNGWIMSQWGIAS